MYDQDNAVVVKNLSKLYRIGYKDDIYDGFAKTVANFIKRPLHNYRKYRSLYRFDDIEMENENDDGNTNNNVIWALKDVSLEIKRGEVVGIIGPNGAGKSTLLKVLCRITTPTKGRAEIRGRVSSLLEVGTGFHPELTGRDNVYLNGSILGMTKKEIDDRFEEIVEFSGIRKFIDTPVKRYSSGMRVRLAFSVAAHLRPDILIIDEVLAVGDEQFQKRCIQKMENVAKEGRTVIFVSHNMSAVVRLCQRCLLLDKGTVMLDGPSGDTVAQYVRSGLEVTSERLWPDNEEAPGNDVARMHAVRACAEDGSVSRLYDIRKPIILEVEFEVKKPDYNLTTHFHVNNAYGIRAFSIHDTDENWRGRPRPVGRYRCRTRIPGNLLSEGMLYIHAVVLNMDPIETICWASKAIAFNVFDPLEGDSARGDWPREIYGAVRPLLEWTTEYEPV